MRFLVIDDSPFDRELIIRRLRNEFRDADYVEISRRAEFDQVITQGDIDAALIDYALKWTDGLDILKKLHVRFPDLPVVMVTDTGNEEVAAEGMKAGLSDYVLKRHLQRLPYALRESLRKARLQREHKELEEQVRQAQKMESLGLLVGGITHDFNNLLTSITGYAQLGLSRVKPGDPLYMPFSHIHETAQRARAMTRQLLAFARQQTLNPHPINVNAVITHLLDFLHKTTPENIEIEFVPDHNVKEIMGDTVQIEQIIMNLCINAYDAMPDGGKVLLKTQNTRISEKDVESLANVQPGPFVLLAVTDSGTGIDEQVRMRVFEPFFTTKESGKGTGLGLSVVHGIVAQHHGFITVESKREVGTTFSIYFPIAAYMPVQMEAEEVGNAQGGTETILLVEDDPDISTLLVEFLQSYGYTVMVAHDGAEGLELFKQHATSISLVMADLMMPKMSGRNLYDHIRRVCPNTRFLFMSGYQATQFGQDIVMGTDVQFMEKPFDLDKLAATIRKVLTWDRDMAKKRM
ncbi:MAG TPA: response regulator [Ktedonobacteraceae bacterium]|nr:response regulator [Ktedonobacteraceae bacterium]